MLLWQFNKIVLTLYIIFLCGV